MGVGHYDMQGGERRLEARFPLATAKGVKTLLMQWGKVNVMPYDRGDYNVVDMLIDFGMAYNLAGITDTQKRALELVLVQGYTQNEVAQMDGVTRQAVQKNISEGINKIAKVYRYWYKKGDY